MRPTTAADAITSAPTSSTNAPARGNVLGTLPADELRNVNAQLESAGPQQILRWVDNTFGNRAIQMSSFGIEGMAIWDMYWSINPKARLATIDTERLFDESYELMQRIEKQYQVNIEVHKPDQREVRNMVRMHGLNLFYKGIENRKLCCNIRKVQPLDKALSDADAWITGLRRDQGMKRTQIAVVEQDTKHDAYKINPLANWTMQDVREYVAKHEVPYNKLHDRGFPSIGCAPCTRAIKPDEDERAGRWWWETDPDAKECGIHTPTT